MQDRPGYTHLTAITCNPEYPRTSVAFWEMFGNSWNRGVIPSTCITRNTPPPLRASRPFSLAAHAQCKASDDAIREMEMEMDPIVWQDDAHESLSAIQAVCRSILSSLR